MIPYLADSDLTVYVGDAIEVLRGLPDGSVDCCVTSPPYWGLRDYSVDGQIGLEATPDLFVAKMVAVFREVRRVLAPHGTCWVNLGDSYATTPPGRGIPGETSGLHGFKTSAKYRETLAKGHATKRNTVVGDLKPKDLVGIPWRVAFALQADGWWLRSDIVWAKPNPMPESVTDRPTKAHEYVFLLTKSGAPSYWVNPRRRTLSASKPPPDYYWEDSGTGETSDEPVEGWVRRNAWRGRDYWFDAEAVREPSDAVGPSWEERKAAGEVMRHGLLGAAANGSGGYGAAPGGRNVRSVWEIATQPYQEAHFATFPEELPRRAIAAGCPLAVCRVCGKPRERIVERNQEHINHTAPRSTPGQADRGWSAVTRVHATTLGWSDCGHADFRPGVVLDPFAGAGTTLLVARKLGRSSVGIELNAEYAELIAKRTRQLSLLAEEPAA